MKVFRCKITGCACVFSSPAEAKEHAATDQHCPECSMPSGEKNSYTNFHKLCTSCLYEHEKELMDDEEFTVSGLVYNA